MGIKLFLVSIGTHERSKEFVKVTDFPADCLFADPDNQLYDALGLARGVGATFFTIDTPFAIKKRIEEGKLGDLADVLPRWQPWLPPKNSQGLQQGGMFLFDGPTTLLTHYDRATADHADLQQLLGRAAQLAASSCDTAACEVPPPQPGAGKQQQ